MIFQKDEIGVPSTLGAIILNIMHVMKIEYVSHVFTWVISLLSIIYLVYKIKNEKHTYDRHKNSGKDSTTASQD